MGFPSRGLPSYLLKLKSVFTMYRKRRGASRNLLFCVVGMIRVHSPA